jgi:hypothetical protein
MADFTIDNTAKNVYVAAGISLFLVWVITDYKVEAPSDSWAAHHGLANR